MRKRAWNGKYTIRCKNENFVAIECFYECPYCGNDTGAHILTISPEAYPLIEAGSFSKTLKCTACSKEAEVIFA